MSVKTLNDDNFDAEVIRSDTPVLVDFYATWCGPCKALSPIVEKLAGDFEGRLKVAKLNIDDAAQTPGRYNIRGVPTLLFFKDGDVVDQVVGLRSEKDLKKMVESLVA